MKNTTNRFSMLCTQQKGSLPQNMHANGKSFHYYFHIVPDFFATTCSFEINISHDQYAMKASFNLLNDNFSTV